MVYSIAINDMFEVSGWPLNNTTIGHPDVNAPIKFGPILEPLTFAAQQQSVLSRGDTVQLRGSEWSIVEISETSADKFALDTRISATTSLFFLRLSNGTAERFLGVELDSFASPLRDSAGNVVPTASIYIWYWERPFYLSVQAVRKDDFNHLMAVCFATGTMIETAAGPRPVQSLRVGDLVRTRDHGFQPLRWLGGRRLSGADLGQAPSLAPIRILAGALGPGQPAQDLTVSPQHRMLVRSPIAERMAGAAEVLVAAVHLLDLPGVDRLTAPEGVGYWHLMFDRHEIVFANGAEAESLYLGPMAAAALSPDALGEIAALFPELLREGGDPRPTARPVLRGGQTRRLVERQVRNRKPLVMPLPAA